MTLCPTGSSPKSGSPAYAWITWVQAQSWLGALFHKFDWLALLFRPLLVDVAVFCAAEPVQPTYPGDAVVVAAATDPQAFETVIQYIKDSATWWLWSQLCQCNASGSPGCSPYLDAHTSNLASNFTPGSAMALGMKFQPLTTGLTCFGVWIDSGAAQTVELIVYLAGEFFQNQTFTLTTGWNQCIFTTPHTLINGHQYWCVGRHAGGSGAYWNGYETASGTPTYSGGLLSFVGAISQPWDLSSTSPASNWFGIEPIVCVSSPVPTAPSPPPLPVTTLPDVPAATCTTVADLCSIINPIVDQGALLKARLDLLQRRLLPFAWITGTAHTGLTGTGSISVQDALGVLVSLTTVPTSWGASSDSPRRLYPAAGIIQGRATTPVDEGRFVRYESEVILFDDSWATSIVYNFKPGIVATLTPLFPEP